MTLQQVRPGCSCTPYAKNIASPLSCNSIAGLLGTRLWRPAISACQLTGGWSHSGLERPTSLTFRTYVTSVSAVLRNVHIGHPLHTAKARQFAVSAPRSASCRTKCMSPNSGAGRLEEAAWTAVGTNPISIFTLFCSWSRLSGQRLGQEGSSGLGPSAQRHVDAARVRPRDVGGAIARNRNPSSAWLRAPVPPAGVAAPANSFTLNHVHNIRPYFSSRHEISLRQLATTLGSRL